MACHAGAVSAAPTPARKVKASNRNAVAWPYATIAAKPAVSSVNPIWAPISRRRLSMMSARAPAGRPSRNIGRLVATCTSDTISGSGSSPVISQPAAAFCIQVPMLETTVATQITVNAVCLNGLQEEVASSP